MRLVFSSLLVAFTLLVAGSAGATTALRVDLNMHLKQSTAVFEARVGGATQGVVSRHSRPYTDTTLYIDRVLYGKVPATIAVRQHKGTVNGRSYRINGDGELTQGARVVVFAVQGPEGRWYLSNLAQSVYTVRGNGDTALVSRKLGGLWLVEKDVVTGRLIWSGRDRTVGMTVGQLRVAIAAAAGTLSGRNGTP